MKKRVYFYRLWIVGIAILCALTMGSCSSSRTTVHKKPTGYTKVRQHQRNLEFYPNTHCEIQHQEEEIETTICCKKEQEK